MRVVGLINAALATGLASVAFAQPPPASETAAISQQIHQTPAWILCLSAFIVLTLIWAALVRLFPRWGKTTVFFEDLSRPRADRQDANRILSGLVTSLLQDPTPVHMQGMHMDLMPGTDRPGFGGLQPAVEMKGAELYDYGPIRVASVEFSLPDAVALIRRLFTRQPAARLRGWVSESNDGVVAFAAFSERIRFRDRRARLHQSNEHAGDGTPQSERQPKPKEWRVTRTGPEARARAIADLAAQILVGTDRSNLTHSWRSFRSFYEAIKLLQGNDAGPSDDTRTTVRDHLEEAVTQDPSNWIARFNLALAVCRDNQQRTALAHFELLEAVIARAWPTIRNPALGCSGQPAFQSVVQHLEKHPECAFLILYNKAMCLSGLGTSSDRTGALLILGHIGRLTTRECDSAFDRPYSSIAGTLDNNVRIELSLYALSAQANLIAGISSFREHGGTASDEDAERVKTLLTEIEVRCASQQEQHWRSLQTSRAIALTAYARIEGLRGHSESARDLLVKALAAEPQFVEAHLLLAELLIERNGALQEDWSQRAEGLIARVRGLSPVCLRVASLEKRLAQKKADHCAGHKSALSSASGAPEISGNDTLSHAV